MDGTEDGIVSSDASGCDGRSNGRWVLLVTSAAPAQSPFSTREKRPPLGIGFLISVLRDAGHHVSFIDNYLQPSDFLEAGFLQKNAIDFVGIYANTICFRDTLRMLYAMQRLRQTGQWRGKIVVGGPHAAVAPQTIPDFVDFIVQGEGEYALRDIVAGKITDRVVRYPRINDLDTLPMPAWDCFVDLPYEWGMKLIGDGRVFTMNTSRGCPFRCAFCSVNSIWSRKYTSFSAERIVSDIEYLVRTYGAKGIYFREDNFTLNEGRLRKFCDLLLARNLGISWVCETRVSNLSRELVHLMARAGAKGFYFGVESGSQRMLDLMRKDITVDQIRDAFRWCRDAGIKTIASTIIAVPGETEADLRQTNELLEEIKPTLVWRNVFTGIPYSDLYHAAVTERSYEYIDDRGIVYLQGHNERVTHYYHDQWNACIPDKEENKDWTNNPKISVLMAVHNGEKFLPQALESIYRQTYQDFELVIVDDASSDRTPEILLGAKDSRTVIYRNAQRQGLTKSLNIGLRLCRGEYVARMDADDVSLPKRFEKQVEVLEKNPQCLVVGCWCVRIDAEGKVCGQWRLPTEPGDIKAELAARNRVAHGTAMVRRFALIQVGGYDERFQYAQDYDLWLRLSEVGELRNIGEYLYALRRWEGAITNAKKEMQDEYAEYARQEAQRRATPGLQIRTDAVVPTQGRRLRIAILPHKNNLSFMGEILAHLRVSHDVQIVDYNEKKDIAAALQTADVCWIEWATGFAARVTQQPRRCRTIVRLHSFEAFCSRAKEICWENVDDLIFVSPHIRDVLKEQIPDIEARVRTHVVPNCVNPAKFNFTDRPRGKNLAFVGSLCPAKNLPFLMQCLKEILAADPGYTLHIAGELFGDELHKGELKHYLRHIERELEIQDSVFYYGRVEDVSSWLNDKDFILSTSIREGHPVNVIEGMAKGLKPVIHNYPGAGSCYPDKWIFNTAQECRDIVLSADFDRRECVGYVRDRWTTERVLPQIDAILQATAPDRSQDSLNTPGSCAAEATPSRSVPAGRPKVTVVTACYEAEAFLPQCIDSILAQTMPEWELFLLDDGSTDGTRRIIEGYTRRDPRIKAFCFDDNKGPYVRRNFAVGRAAADFIVIHDADDIMAPNKLERLHAAITADDRLGIVGSFYRMFLDGWPDVDHTEDVLLAATHEQILDMYRRHGTSDFCPHGIAIIRKRMFEEIGLYDENPFGSDSFWLVKAMEYACRTEEIRFQNVPEFLTLRRMHPDSQTEKLPSFDPRSPRAKFKAYRRSQIRKLRERLDASPNADIRVELRGSICNDFVARHGHLFQQWATEPLTSRIAEEFIARILFQFVALQFVRCIETCGIVERLVEGIARSVRCYDLVRGLAYFALALPEQSRQCLQREFETHGTQVARDFCRKYLERQDACWTRAQRLEILRDMAFGTSEKEALQAVGVSARQPLMDSRNGCAARLSIIVEVGEDPSRCRELFLRLNEQTEKAFEVIALVPPACRQTLDPLVAQSDFGIVLVVHVAEGNRWEQRSAAAAHARGPYLAFLDEHAIPEKGFVKAVLDRFGRHDINGLRGRIVGGPTEDQPRRYDLGDAAVHAACDTDEFCAFRKDTFTRLGGFPPTPFHRGAILMSYRIYTDRQGPQRPILYCPEIVIHYSPLQRRYAHLVDEFALEDRFCIEHFKRMWPVESGADQTGGAFLGFVESLYPAQERSEQEHYQQCRDTALFFERLFPARSLEWGEKALAYKPDSLKAHYVTGASYARLGKTDQAQRHFEAILDGLEAQLALGRLDCDQSEFRDYANLEECYVASCTLLAQCYAQQNRYEEVHRVYGRLLSNPHVTLAQDQKRRIQNVHERLNRICTSSLARGAGHRSVSPGGIDACVTPKRAEPMCETRPGPKVTVVTACHNCEKHLSECIESVRSQSLQAWELFLLDDGSTDGTRRIIDTYARLDPRIRPYRFEDNRGPYVRRNFAIAQAGSDFVVIQDADDIMGPDKLETLHREITQDPRLAMVGSCYRTFLDQWRGPERAECNDLPLTQEEIVERFTTWRHTMSHGSAIIRKALFGEIGPYDENPFASDSFWSAKLGEYIRRTTRWQVKNVPQYLTCIRMHAMSQTHQVSTFDPRNRRARYRQYCEGKLRKIRETMQAEPGRDLARELRECDCSDFLTRFKAQIVLWESEPLDARLIPRLLESTVWLFNHAYYISCVTMLNGVEAMEGGLARRMKNFDLLGAMALYALDMKEQSLSRLHREIEHHDSAAAGEFLRDYFDHGARTDVRQWCADHGDRFDLQMTDARPMTAGAAAAMKS